MNDMTERRLLALTSRRLHEMHSRLGQAIAAIVDDWPDRTDSVVAQCLDLHAYLEEALADIQDEIALRRAPEAADA